MADGWRFRLSWMEKSAHVATRRVLCATILSTGELQSAQLHDNRQAVILKWLASANQRITEDLVDRPITLCVQIRQRYCPHRQWCCTGLGKPHTSWKQKRLPSSPARATSAFSLFWD
jgi:hypothetical protein